ncbi:MAG: InlB B-repeat-containing protein [Paludibacteraceae bacterium]|nr:InlB B-repeat-containing protein [Paludibacteraceae bacterium]
MCFPVFEVTGKLQASAQATKYSVTYDLNGGTGTEPTQGKVAENGTFTVASAEGITPPAGQEFAGWSDGTNTYNAGDTYTMGSADVILTAQWQAETPKYDVTYSLNGGTGTEPTQGKVAENGTFTVASAEGITPPAGKEFAGWSDGTNTYNAGDTYTMGATAVTFTAQWKAAPTVIFHYQWTGSSTQPAVGDVLTGIGGTITVERKEGSTKTLSNESAKFVSSVPSDMKFTTSDSKGVKFGTSDVWFRIALNSGNFEEGDMIAICGYEAFLISSSTAFDGDISSSLSTGSNKENYEVKQCVIPSIESFPNLYIRRVSSSCGFAAIKVIRPAQKEILSTDITLSAVAVNTEAISEGNLATLKADPYKLDLTSEFVEAPTIAFTKQTVITYEDATTKTKTENIEVVAAKVDGKWQAQTEINGVTYTVTAKVPAAYTVIYKDGGTELASESVKVGEHPTAEGVESKPLYTLSWKLDEEVVELSNVNGTANQKIILTAVWTPKYATSLDFAAVTTDGKTGDNPIVDFLASGNMVASNLGGSEWETSTSKSGYVGYKLKNSGATITFLAQEDKRVTITFGSIAADVTLKKGDETVTISANSGDGAETVYNLDVTTDMVVAITTSNGSTVTLKSITIGEIPNISDDATLKDLKVNGTTIAGFNSATTIYYLTVPYGTEVANMPKITEATPNHASAAAVIYPEEGPEWEEEYGCYLQQVVVTAEDGTKGYYHVRTTVDAKQGVTIIKATHTGATTADVIGAIGGTCDKKTQSDGKLGSNGHYFGIKLAEGTFKSGDVIKVVASALNGGNTITLFADNEGTTEIGSVAYDQTTKTAYFTLTADVENVYIYRVSSACNSNVEYIEVQRYMAPFIESFVIGDAVGTITNKTIAIEVPASADVTALNPTIVAWANGGAKVTPTGAQDFTNPVEYSVASAYAEDGIIEYTVTVTKAAASADATLKTLTINGNALTLVDGVYEYDYELPYGTTADPTVEVEKNDANANAVVTSVSLTEAVITVTAENGATQEYVINFTVSRAISYVIYDGSVQQNIESRTGNDATGFSWSMGSNVTINGSEVPSSWNGKNYRYVIKGFKPNESTNNITSIVIPAGYLAKITLVGTTNSEGERSLFIATSASRNKEDAMGDYIITSSDFNAQGFTTDYLQAGTYYLGSTEACRLYELSVVLYPIDYERPVRQGYYGTICLPNKGQMIGAAVYEIAYMDYKDGAPYKIYFDEILNGKMEAGVPYVFLPNEGYNQLMVTYTAIFDAAADDANGLYGFIGTSATDEFPIPGGVGNYIIQNNQYREVLAGADARIVSNRAYIKLSEVPGYNNPLYVAPAPAPGRKRIAMGTTGAQVATGVDQVEGDEVPTKMIINGQLFILRGEKMYDAQGKLVK